MGRDQIQRRKIGAEAPPIASQEPHIRDRGMRADEEVRQHAGSGAARRAVSPVGLPREKQRRARNWSELDSHGLEQGVYGLDVGNPTEILAYTISLMKSRPRVDARSNCRMDQSPHTGSLVKTSRSTLASTNVAFILRRRA